MVVIFRLLLLLFLGSYGCIGQQCGAVVRDGASCGTEKWRQDSFCLQGKCVRSVERPFKLKVVIVYPEDSLSPDERQKGMLLVGEGLGLSWKKKTKFRKGMKNQWFLSMSYLAGGKAVLCKTPTQCEAKQQQVEFRVFLGNKEMLGPNFLFKLPPSGSLMPKNDVKVPRLSFYPWFDRRDCTVIPPQAFTLEGIGQRKISVLLPASFYENKLKRYSTLITFGHRTLLSMKNVLMDVTARRGLVEEIVVIGLEVNDPVRDIIPSHAPILKCKNSPLRKGDRTCDYCIKCLSDEFTEPCDKFEFLREINKCAKKWTVPGQGYHYLLAVLDKVLPQLASKYRARINKKSLGIMGYGLAGMMACHAALKLSNRFGTAICMSPRFSWPDLDANKREFFQLLGTKLEGICKLKIYIDANENDDWQFTTAAVSKSAEEAVQLLQSKHQFTLNEDLFYFPLTYRGKGRLDTLKPEIILARTWVPLTTMYRAGGNAAAQTSCSSGLMTNNRLFNSDASGPATSNQVSDDNPGGESCTDQVSVFAMIGSIVGTFLITLVVTIIVMYMCQSSAAKVAEAEPMLQ